MRGIRNGLLFAALIISLCCACKGTDSPSGGVSSDGSLVSIGGTELSTGEIAYLMGDVIDQYSLYQEINWDGMIEGVPAERYILDKTLETAVNAHVTGIKATELGYALTDDEQSAIDWDIALEIEYRGGREAFLQILGEAGLTEELYRFYSYTVPYLHDKMLNELFGPDGQYAPDDEAMRAYFQKNYITASYIFLSGTDEVGEPLTGTMWETQKSVAEALRRQAASGEDFFTMVDLYGQDYLMSLNPEGMPISLGQFGTAFDTALTSLSENEISEVIATIEGFYIILRLPEDWVWFDQNKDDIWYFCGSEAFSEKIIEWSKTVDIIVSDAFYSLDPREMVAVG